MTRCPATVTTLATSCALLALLGCPGGGGGEGTDTTSTTADTEPGPTSTTMDATGPEPTTGVSTGADETADADSGTTGDPPPGACGATPTFEDGQAPSAELHVATDGADGPGCGAADSPCATVGAAASQATPGTAIRVHAGTYAGGDFIAGLDGQADAPIWLGGAPGEARPVFDGGGQAFQLSGARYVVVHDLEVANSTANGINVDDDGQYDDPEVSRHLVFRGLDIHDIGQGGNNDCLKLSGIDDFWVLDSTFAACGGGMSGSGIDMVGCHHGLIARNSFSDMFDSGNAIQAKGGCDDVEIRANRFQDAGARTINMGGSTGFEFFRPSLSGGENFEARDIRVVANLMQGSVAPIAYVGCVDCSAVHNTIVDPENWVIRILQETVSTAEFQFAPSSGGRFSNNIVYFDRSALSTTVNVGGNTAPETFEFANNLWYAHDDPGASDPGGELPVPETDGVYGNDPMFLDAAGGDYGVPAGSPAASAGRTEPETAGGDILGECYPEPPTIGAWAEPQ